MDELEYHKFVICKLTKLIEYKCNCLELLFLRKFGELSIQYDKDIKCMRDALKQKFEKTNRHIDESVFTILNKSHRFECDLEKIYKKLLTLFVQPMPQHISRGLFIKDENPNRTVDISRYKPPECNCVEEVLPCNFAEKKTSKCCCLCPKEVAHESQEKQNYTLKFVTPSERRRLERNKQPISIGKNQSPIEISTGKAILINMPAIELIGYRNLLPAPIKLVNTGHSLILNVRQLSANDLKLGEFLPYVLGGKLEGQYEFEYMQFHWGEYNCRGAEHILNDVQYAMEIQIINRNKKYKDLKTALGYADGLVGLAFFCRISEYDEPSMEIIVMNLENLKNPKDIVEMDATFSLSSLLENARLDRFYTYKGSLTLPPYSEVVTWVVFPDPLLISSSQIDKFRQLSIDSSYDSNNIYRNVQNLGNRRIFLREGNIRTLRIDDLDNVHYSKWHWYE